MQMLQEANTFTSDAPKVMIVEDEAIIARDIQMQLTRIGFSITGTAPSAAVAFQCIERIRPDIVLMDIRIRGEMDGIHAGDIVRTRYALPVIYVTAHADEMTLERARLTEPFGYIVKPFGKMNIKSVLWMALHKHQAERGRERRRSLLASTLQGLSDAVLVADESGQILFLNRAAEDLTGWRLEDATGKSLLQIASIRNQDARLISADLLEMAVMQGTPVAVPPACALISKHGACIEISGQLAVSAGGGEQANIIVTLRDATVQRRENLQLRQEQKMLLAGELARGVACEFFALFDLIENTAAPLAENQPESDDKRELGLICRASQIGSGMSKQLLELDDRNKAAHFVNVAEYLIASKSILQRACGAGVTIDISCGPDLGFVLNTGNHVEQILLQLILEGKERVDDHGALLIVADVHREPVSAWRSDCYVHLSVRAEKSLPSGAPSDQVTVEPGSPQFGLALIRALATASEGFTRMSELTDSLSLIEIYLPRYDSGGTVPAVASDYPSVILLIGFQLMFAHSIRQTVGHNVLLLEAPGLDEAALISALYVGEIDLVLLDESRFNIPNKDLTFHRIRTRRPDISFMDVALSSHSLDGDRLGSTELGRRIKGFLLNRNLARAVVSAR